MAKYTEIFADYVENSGYDLPEAFDEIEGFEDLFLKYYCDKEIGFETENLFAIKLEGYADLYIPPYADRITKLATAWGFVDTPARTHYATTSTEAVTGERKSKQTELPINSSTAQPNMVAESDEATDTNDVTYDLEENNIQDKMYMVDKLNEEVHIILLELLRRFEPCFMRIY